MTTTSPPPGDARAWFLAARERQQAQLSRVLDIGHWAGQISHLVHLLQRERGASNIWLCSGGELFARERVQSARETQQATASFQAGLPSPPAALSGAFCSRLACALWALDQLPELRQRLSRGEVAAQEAMSCFNCAIRHLLSLVPEASEALESREVVQGLTALYSFMQGKELVGQERALGAIGFTEGSFTAELRQQLVDRIDGQQRCFAAFLALADPVTVARFHQRGEACLETEQLRRIACTRLPEKGAATLRWFELQTRRIDALRDLEESLIGQLMALAAAALATAREAESQDEPAFARWVASHASDDIAQPPNRHLLPLVRQQARELETLSRQLASLQTTLEERKVIDKAKALLIRHQGMSEEQAWQQLRKLAMDQNRRMVEIARAMLTLSGLWPDD